MFVHVVTGRARGVTKGVHYIAFLAGAHQNDNFNFEKLFSNFLIMFGHAQISSPECLEVFWAAQNISKVNKMMIFKPDNNFL